MVWYSSGFAVGLVATGLRVLVVFFLVVKVFCWVVWLIVLFWCGSFIEVFSGVLIIVFICC